MKPVLRDRSSNNPHMFVRASGQSTPGQTPPGQSPPTPKICFVVWGVGGDCLAGGDYPGGDSPGGDSPGGDCPRPVCKTAFS